MDFFDKFNLFLFGFVIGMVLFFVIFYRIISLWYVQSSIVVHVYGQVFESEVDWKLYRLEKMGYESIE